jgi:hypothetical protein
MVSLFCLPVLVKLPVTEIQESYRKVLLRMAVCILWKEIEKNLYSTGTVRTLYYSGILPICVWKSFAEIAKLFARQFFAVTESTLLAIAIRGRVEKIK